jgi:uncharacterized membrane protein
MSSAGANCLHVNHVNTQMPYALLVAGFSSLGFLFAGIIAYRFESKAAMIVMPVMILIEVLTVICIRKKGHTNLYE